MLPSDKHDERHLEVIKAVRACAMRPGGRGELGLSQLLLVCDLAEAMFEHRSLRKRIDDHLSGGTPRSSIGAIPKDGLLVSEERVCSILAERFKPESEEFRKARKAVLVILHEARRAVVAPVSAIGARPGEVERVLKMLDGSHKAFTVGTGYDPAKYSSHFSEAADLIRRLVRADDTAK